MKLGLAIFLAAAIATLALRPCFAADAATSDNYQLTSVSIDAGGLRNSSSNYVNDGAIGMIAVRSLANLGTLLIINNAGYTATLNNPPLPFDDILSHPFDQPLTILPASLLQNDTDSDGETLRVYSADANTEAKGAIAVNGDNFIYSPPTTFNGIDHFNYRVIDTGGDVTEATVTMVVAPAIESQGNQTIAIFKLSDGSYLLRFRYLKGFSEYQILTTTSPELPWQVFEIIRAGGDGVASLIVKPDAPHRYFRALVF
jgi:hypothetical protein